LRPNLEFSRQNTRPPFFEKRLSCAKCTAIAGQEKGVFMLVRDIMHSGVKVINHKLTVEQAAKMMAENDIGSIPVEKNDKLIGMITDRDITIRVIATGKNPKVTKVSECMTEGINYCFDDNELDVVARKMKENKQRRLPVINRQKRLVGIISLAEITNIRLEPNMAKEILSTLTH
jgi:CBS domain-containing protein